MTYMEPNRDWMETVRSRLRDAEVTPPADGWERLERALHPAPRVPLWRLRIRRFAVAAAVLLCCVTAGELLLRPNPQTAGELPLVASAEDLPLTEPERVGTAPDAEPATLARAERIPDEPSAKSMFGTTPDPAALADAHPQDPASLSSDLSEQPSEASTQPPSAQTPSHNPAEAAPAASAATSATAAPGPRASEQASGRVSSRAAAGRLFPGEPARPMASRRRAAFGLFAAGGMNASGHSAGLASRSFGGVSVGSGAVDLSAPAFPDYESGSFRHRQPLGFGLSVRYGFSHGLSLETGVNYTLLRSDVHMPLAAEDFSQKLHFIGVPLRVNWNFLQRNRFSLYIGAGCMAETCIAAKFGSASVDEYGVFWSVMGAVGAEYRLTGPVGLYFEPDVSYYFNDTRLHTSRTDSPATFTLRLGVRLSF